MFDSLTHMIPLPFGTNVGEVIESIAAGANLRLIMDDKGNTMADDVVDNVLAYTMVVIALTRKRLKK